MKFAGRISAAMLLASMYLTPAYADDAKAAIDAVNLRISAAVAKGDAASIAAMYAADGQLMPAGSAPIRGRDAIQQYWQAGLDAGIGGLGLKTVEVFGTGETATEVGEYEVRDKAGAVLDHGKYIVIWKDANGSWQLARDMYSSNVPPPKN